MTNRFMSTGSPTLMTVVPGIRPSLAKSLEAKRESQTFVDVLAAEDVGKFPDRNMTEAFSVLVA
jgi:iron complex outermembrane recepter protein